MTAGSIVLPEDGLPPNGFRGKLAISEYTGPSPIGDAGPGARNNRCQTAIQILKS